MKNNKIIPHTRRLLAAAITLSLAGPAAAYNLYSENGGELNLDIEAVAGIFSSEENYLYDDDRGGADWQEAYIKYGVSGSQALASGSSLFGGLNLLSSGTWFQGEVAAHYAGPFNSDATVQHVGIKASPSETLSIGALFFDFSETAAGSGALDGQEWDLYAEWVVSEHFILSPLVGFYTPDNSAADGGTQLGSDDTNTYAQLIAIVPF